MSFDVVACTRLRCRTTCAQDDVIELSMGTRRAACTLSVVAVAGFFALSGCESSEKSADKPAAERTPTFPKTKNRSAERKLLRAPPKASSIRKAAPQPKQLPPARPGQVIVREHTSESEPLEVRCLATEQLVGGSCAGGKNLNSEPVGYSAAGTVGAGWRCEKPGAVMRTRPPMKVYALCQGMAAPATKTKTKTKK